MDCKNEKEKDEYDENLQCFHKVKFCELNDLICKGSDGVCSLFSPIEEPEMAEEEDKPEEEETPEEEEEDKKPEEEEEAKE